MAYRVVNDTGTTDTGTNTPTLHASTNVIVPVGGIFTGNFTAPNTSNKATGVLVHLTNKAFSGTPTTLTATLYESGVATACTVSITLSAVNTNTWIYFRVPTPYTFTTVVANSYKWQVKTDSGQATAAGDSGGTLPAFVSSDDRTSTPASGDYCYGVGPNNSTAITYTITGTVTLGNNVTSGVARSITNAFYVSNGCTLAMDTAASSTLNHRGNIYVDSGGALNCGTTGSPLSSSYVASLIANTNGGGVTIGNTGSSQLHGQNKSSAWSTTYVSGVGTAANPLITAGDIGSVGDEILIAASSSGGTSYNETESRFIITKNSSTSYVVSSTSGGAETALTYTHAAGALIDNVQRNIIIKGLNASTRTSFIALAQTAQGTVDVDWVRFENISSDTFLGAIATNNISMGDNTNFDYCVGYGAGAGAFVNNVCTTAITRTGLVTYNTVAAAAGAIIISDIATYNSQNVTLADCHTFGTTLHGFGISGSYACNFTRCIATGGTSSNALYGGFAIGTSGLLQFTDCEAHTQRVSGVSLSSGTNITFTSCDFGNKGTNGTQDVYTDTGFIGAYFDTCNFSSASMIGNYLNMTLGSEVRFSTMNGTANNHKWYTVRGSAQSTGSGLSDTTVRTPGSLGVRLTPENNSVGFTWDFLVSAEANTVVGKVLYIQKNATFGTSTAKVELWLPGSAAADATVTLTNTTGTWQTIPISAYYSSSIDGLATIKVIGITSTSGAYLYVDDLDNAGNTVTNSDKMTGLDTWYQGKPSPVINPSSLSAATIWGFPTTNLTTANTTGNQVKKLLTVAKFLGLK